jgi:hypothetical protein
VEEGVELVMHKVEVQVHELESEGEVRETMVIRRPSPPGQVGFMCQLSLLIVVVAAGRWLPNAGLVSGSAGNTRVPTTWKMTLPAARPEM